MLDFEVQRFTRRCAATNRELAPGETFYSVLVSEGADVVRRDYSLAAWTGPPEICLGWWRSEVPDLSAQKVKWAPHDVLLHYLQALLDDPSQRDTAYVLTLLLIRRRIFKLEATEHLADGSETLLVYCQRNETEYRIPVETPTAERSQQIQQELVRLLFAQGEPTREETS